MTWRRCSVVAAALALSACELHCGTPKQLTFSADRAAIEAEIRKIYEGEIGVAPDRITCPGEGSRVEVRGESFTCTTSLGGAEVPFVVRPGEKPGSVNISFETKLVPSRRIEKQVTDAFARQGHEVKVADCGPPRLLTPSVDGTFECSGEAKGGPGHFLVRWTDAEGAYKIAFLSDKLEAAVSEEHFWIRRATFEAVVTSMIEGRTGKKPEKIVCPGSGLAILTKGETPFPCTAWSGGLAVPLSGRLDTTKQKMIARDDGTLLTHVDIRRETAKKYPALRKRAPVCPAPEVRLLAPGEIVTCTVASGGKTQSLVAGRQGDEFTVELAPDAEPAP